MNEAEQAIAKLALVCKHYNHAIRIVSYQKNNKKKDTVVYYIDKNYKPIKCRN